MRVLPNGNYEVGVHIADVSHFVEHNSAMDKEAADRSNTTYLVERRLDMLPVCDAVSRCRDGRYFCHLRDQSSCPFTGQVSCNFCVFSSRVC